MTTPKRTPGAPPLVPWLVGTAIPFIIFAATKAEARAAAKRELRIRGRLPVGIVVQRKVAKPAVA